MKKEWFILFLCLCSLAAVTQEVEPRAYANLPTGANALAVVYGYANGNVLTDPSKPIQGASVQSHNVGLGYVRTFGLASRLARVQVALPLIFLSGKGEYFGRDTSIARDGFGDARIRLGINLWGSPALSVKEFRTYQQKTIVGVSLVTTIPTGLYYKEKLINLGSNRWIFKPEVGVSRRFSRFYTEGYAGIWFYTTNKKYLSVKTLEQEPVVSLQGHVAYYFKNQMWIGVNANWFNGGESRVNDIPAGDLKDNWRLGATWSFPLVKQHSLKLQFHMGAFTDTGYDYSVTSLTYQYVFF